MAGSLLHCPGKQAELRDIPGGTENKSLYSVACAAVKGVPLPLLGPFQLLR